MKQADKIINLKENHLSEWLTTRRTVEDELSQKQTFFCFCGKLATGLHERNCTRFNKLVDKETMLKLKHLIN